MKKMLVLSLGLVGLFIATTPVWAQESHTMYRMYNPNSGEHFYTASQTEAQALTDLGWQAEGEAWQAPLTGIPVYRMYNPIAGDHHYTTSDVERQQLQAIGWKDEGIGWYGAQTGVPLYRVYNPFAKTGIHHYTTSLKESDALAAIGWQTEGIAWYGVAPSTHTTTANEQAISNQVVSLLNARRQALGVAVLTVDPDLTTGAQIRTREVASYDTSAADQAKLAQHLRPDGRTFGTVYADLDVGTYQSYAENIALVGHFGTSGETAAAAMAAWEQSQQGHRETMDSAYWQAVGVAVYEQDGQTVVIQHFAKK